MSTEIPFPSEVPEARCWPAREGRAWRADGEFVLYWMTANRRPRFNFSLQRAVEWARHLHKPLVILEALRAGYRWNAPRFQRWVMQGMEDNLAWFEHKPVTYYPYVEHRPDDDKGLLESLAGRASLVVGDHFPSFFLPHMVQAAADKLPVLLELVDSNGLLPLEAAPKVYGRAVDFRRFLQKSLAPHLEQFPLDDPLKGSRLPHLQGTLPEWKRWKPLSAQQLAGPLDDFHTSGPAQEVSERGGFRAAEAALGRFWKQRLPHYLQRSQPSERFQSGLSPYFHWGHLSVHQVFAELSVQQHWNPGKMVRKATGSKDGAWGMSEQAEAFLDEMVTWRELGYNLTHRSDDYESYESLPEWARKTLEDHLHDERPHLYKLEALEAGATYDPLWNAAQRQIVEEGRIHNYMRMLWGKKVLEWTRHPREALEILTELNNRYALDGRNPNSYSGILWCFGRYDRPWFERPIFGKVRAMTSESTARKFDMEGYLKRWS